MVLVEHTQVHVIWERVRLMANGSSIFVLVGRVQFFSILHTARIIKSRQELLPRGVQGPVLEKEVRVCQPQIPCGIQGGARHVNSIALRAAWDE